MDKIPPPPQAVPVIGAGGRLTTPWNLWLTAFIKTLQDVGEGLDIQGLSGSGSGGVATSGAAPAVGLVLGPNAEGVSNLGARSDHIHQRSLGAEQDYIDGPSTVQSVNVLGPILESIVEPDLTSDLRALLFGYWPLTEASGSTRKMSYGTATPSDLIENGGTVSTSTGPYGNAPVTVSASVGYLGDNNNVGPAQDIASGMTVTLWLYMDVTTPGPYQLITFSDLGAFSTYGLYLDAYDRDLYWRAQYGSTGSKIEAALRVPTGRWFFFAGWYDPSTKRVYIQIDGRDMSVSSDALTAGQEASINSIDTLGLAFNWRASYGKWPGRMSALCIFPAVLTQAQRERVMASRMSFVANPAAIELFGG